MNLLNSLQVHPDVYSFLFQLLILVIYCGIRGRTFLVGPVCSGIQILAEEFIRDFAKIPYLVSSNWREICPHLLDCFPRFVAIQTVFLSQMFGVSVLHI